MKSLQEWGQSTTTAAKTNARHNSRQQHRKMDMNPYGGTTMTRYFAIAAFSVFSICTLALAGCNGAQYNTSPQLESSETKVEANNPSNSTGSPQTDLQPEQPKLEAEEPSQNPEGQSGNSTGQSPDERQPRQGGNDRPGGPQSTGGGMRGTGGANLALRDDVRKELGLTEEQVESLWTKLREIVPQPGPSNERPQVNPEEIAEKVIGIVKSVLTPAQQKRLQELQLQRTGPAALAQKEVAAQVGISEATRAKIEKMIQDNRDRAREQFSTRPSNQEEAQKRQEEMRKNREKLQTDILALLTPAQRAKWEALLGKPFEFQRRRSGGPGGLMTPRD